MSILVDKNTRVLCQGLGKAGTFHALQCKAYGTQLVGRVARGAYQLHSMPDDVRAPGRVGVSGRSRKLTYEQVWQLSNLKLGRSTRIGLGGDPIVGTSFNDALKLFQDDPKTEAILMMG